MSNNNSQKPTVYVETGVMVTMPYERWEALKNVEAEKERYAQHIIEHQGNLSKAELKVKELEDKVIELELKLEDTSSAKVSEPKSTSKKKTPVKK